MQPQLPQEFDAWNPNVSEGKRDESVEDRERDAILTFIGRLPCSIERATELKGYVRSTNGRAVNADENEKVVQFVFRRLRIGVDWCVEKNIGTLTWLDSLIAQFIADQKVFANRQSRDIQLPMPVQSPVWLFEILKQLATGETEEAKQMLREFWPGVQIKDTVVKYLQEAIVAMQMSRRDAIRRFIDRLPNSLEVATERLGYARSESGRAINADEHEKVVEFVFRRLRFGVEWCVEKKIGTLKWLDFEIERYANGLKESALRQSKPFRPPSPERSAVWLLVILKRLASGDTETAKQMLSECGPRVAIKDTVELRLQYAILKEHEAIYHPESNAEPPDTANETEEEITPPDMETSFEFRPVSNGYYFRWGNESGNVPADRAIGLHDFHQVIRLGCAIPLDELSVGQKVNDSYSKQLIATPADVLQMQAEGRRLMEEIDSSGSELERTELQESLDKLLAAIKSMLGLNGKPRDMNNPLDKIRPRILSRKKTAVARMRVAGTCQPFRSGDQY